MAKRGRPRVHIDLEEVKKLAAIACTDSEIAGWFGVTVKTIARRKRTTAFSDAYEAGRAQGRISIRRTLFHKAQGEISGSVAAAIFLAKHLLPEYHDRNSSAADQEPTSPPDPESLQRRLRELYGLPEVDPDDPNAPAKEPESTTETEPNTSDNKKEN